MNILRVEIDNIVQIEHLQLDRLGRVTRLTGGNETGKTSVLKAFAALLAGQIDKDLVRSGARQGAVEAELDDGTVLRLVIPRASANRLTVTERWPDGSDRAVPGPREFLDGLVASTALNPLEVMNPKTRREFFLRATNVRLDAAELTARLGETPPLVDLDRSAVEVLEDVRRHYYARRTEAGQLKDRKAAALADARSKLAPLPARAVPLAEESRWVQAEIAQAQAAVQQEKNKTVAIAEYTQRIERAAQGRDAQAKICEDLQFRLADAQAELARREGELGALRERSALDTPNEDILAAARDQVATGQARLAELGLEQALVAAHERAAAMRAEADEAAAAWEVLDARVKTCGKEAQAEILARAHLPAGLTYEDGDFALHGHPLTHASTSRALRLAVQAVKAAHVADPIKIMLLDNAECLDPESWAELEAEQAKDDGWYYVQTRVGAGPLAVETGDPRPVAVTANPFDEPAGEEVSA